MTIEPGSLKFSPEFRERIDEIQAEAEAKRALGVKHVAEATFALNLTAIIDEYLVDLLTCGEKGLKEFIENHPRAAKIIFGFDSVEV